MYTQKVESQGSANGLVLRVMRANHPLQEVYVDADLTIGRTVANRIMLDDDSSVDRSHARVTMHDDGSFSIACIEDGSVLIPCDMTGQELPPVREIRLANGVRFRIGNAEFDCESARGPIPASGPKRVARPCPLCEKELPTAQIGVQACPHCQRTIFTFRRAGESAALEIIPADYGPYRVDGFIANGGMGLVFHGRHRESSAEAAVKILWTEGEDTRAIPRFMNEAQVLKAVKSKRTVQLLLANRTGRFHFLAMEWVNGVSLEEKMESARKGLERFTIATAFRWMEEICRGLADIHQAGIVHRDLKPGNILFNRFGELKISDFGIARRIGVESSLTTQGSSIGTLRYMSPEQLAGGQIDQRSDQFSLGVVLHELLLGEAPDFGKTDRAAIHIDQLKARQLPKNVEAQVFEIMERLLARAPDGRFEDLEALADRFRDLREQTPASAQGAAGETEIDPSKIVKPATGTGPVQPGPMAQPRKHVSLVAALLLIMALGGMAAGWMLKPQPTSSPIPYLVQKQIDRLQEENEKLKADKERLLSEIANLEKQGPPSPLPPSVAPSKTDSGTNVAKENEQLQIQINELKSTNGRLQQETDKLQRQLDEEKQKTATYIENAKSLRAGVEIGSKGVKAVVVRRSADGFDFALEEKLKLNPALVDGSGRFTREALEETSNSVAEAVARLMRNDKVQGLAKYSFVISSGAVAAVNEDKAQLDELKALIARKVSTQVEQVKQEIAKQGLRRRSFPYDAAQLHSNIGVVSAEQEAEAGFLGMVRLRQWSEREANEAILIDIGSGNTKAGYYEFPDGQADAIPLFRAVNSYNERGERQSIPGAVQLSGQLEKCRSDEERFELVKTAVEVPFRESIKRKPRLTNARRAVLAGGVVWALASLVRPDQCDSRVVRVTVADIDRFADMIASAGGQFPAVKGEEQLPERARTEISAVKSTFTAPQLAAGAAILQAVAKACRMREQDTEVVFYRDSLYSWIAYVAQQGAQ
jgi:eukaryotic-like serine/threonine-protein kinase